MSVFVDKLQNVCLGAACHGKNSALQPALFGRLKNFERHFYFPKLLFANDFFEKPKNSSQKNFFWRKRENVRLAAFFSPLGLSLAGLWPSLRLSRFLRSHKTFLFFSLFFFRIVTRFLLIFCGKNHVEKRMERPFSAEFFFFYFFHFFGRKIQRKHREKRSKFKLFQQKFSSKPLLFQFVSFLMSCLLKFGPIERFSTSKMRQKIGFLFEKIFQKIKIFSIFGKNFFFGHNVRFATIFHLE